MEIETLLGRARSGLGKATRYDSPGVMPGFGASTWPHEGACNDCSGFVLWCLRFPSSDPASRRVNHPLYTRLNGGWFETGTIYADAGAPVGYFRRIADAVPGALLAYPDQVAEDGATTDGHAGIVVEAAANRQGVAAATRVVHCSLTNWRETGDAIRETDARVFLRRPDTLVLWFEGVAGGPPATTG